MSCKKPILLAIEGISKELVEIADCGICVIPEDGTNIANEIKSYMQKKELHEVQGNNGYEYAKKHFDREQLALSYIDCIKKHIKK